MAVKVTLLAHTPNPEQTVAMAAKLCYSPSDIENIRDGLTEEKTTSFLNMLTDLGHASPTEHASFTFGIEGISRACSHQLVRHRIASYSQQSQRYVDGTKFDFVTPPEIQNNPKALAAYEKRRLTKKSATALLRDISQIFSERLSRAVMRKLWRASSKPTKSSTPRSSKKRTRTRGLFCRTPRLQKLSAPLTRAVCTTSLRTAAVTAHSGKSAR